MFVARTVKLKTLAATTALSTETTPVEALIVIPAPPPVSE
jgi:hypothetical protein